MKALEKKPGHSVLSFPVQFPMLLPGSAQSGPILSITSVLFLFLLKLWRIIPVLDPFSFAAIAPIDLIP